VKLAEIVDEGALFKRANWDGMALFIDDDGTIWRWNRSSGVDKACLTLDEVLADDWITLAAWTAEAVG